MSGLEVIDGTPDVISGYLREREKKRMMTDVAKGKLTMKEAEKQMESDLKIKVTETEDSVILDIEEIELEEIEPKKTQKRKLNAKGGKK